MLTTSAGVTRGRSGRLSFLGRDDAVNALQAAGFDVRIIEMRSRRPYSDILYLGTITGD
jgi:hypothetical protein